MAAAAYAGVTALIATIARPDNPTRASAFSASIAANGADTRATAISLPGPDCAEKTELEQQLAALCARVDFLERKNRAAADPSALPPTPAQDPSEDAPAYTPSGAIGDRGSPGHGRRGSNMERAQWVSNWLAAKEPKGGAEEPAAALTEEQLNHLRAHLNQQADQASHSTAPKASCTPPTC